MRLRVFLPQRRRTGSLMLVAGLVIGLLTAPGQPLAEDDPFGSDWPEGPGREETGYLCGACHSLRLVTQQGLSRRDWDETLDWMVEEQEMEPLDAEEREIILSYLSEHFGVDHRPARLQAVPGFQAIPTNQ
ncbi:hypothetical protein [Pelagibius sp.]|uniref:hypothetical protein n=1 Tax=Pelagibius sp. TaxID=1931238 RepID=UPI002632F7B2|nr:hypothetical protein [Pelagibius sp.]